MFSSHRIKKHKNIFIIFIILFMSACRVAGEPETLQLGTAAAEAPASLKTVKVPDIPDLDLYVKNKPAAIALGKAFFWDQATGSDGVACASCHYQAGVDIRIKNQLSPGLLAGDGSFQRTASGSKGGPNYTLTTRDFPLHQFNNPTSRASGLKFDTNDVVSSEGVYHGIFSSSPENERNDTCERSPDPIFHVGGKGTRRVEPRNSPPTVNAALNFRNFWDGRASNSFNGVDPFGLRNGQALVLRNVNGTLSRVPVDLRNASLASQGVGPAVSDIEMICKGRSFASFGRKMLPRVALSLQVVHAQDSVLAPYRDPSGKGLRTTYEGLIKQAFNDSYWNAVGDFSGFTQMESNFSLFWGLALHLYQATLISDNAPYDRWAEGSGGALSKAQLSGLDIFLNKGKCINCHKGPEFSNAASELQAENQKGGLIERMLNGDGGVALYDKGFYNIGVTRTADDLGLGGKDPFGNPLSFSEQYKNGHFVDAFKVDSCTFTQPFAATCAEQPADLSAERSAVRGAFKTPILRNVELTGPFFHDGSAATLEQVVELYNRGGNFANPELHPDIVPLGLSSTEVANLVAFMKALTDPRVRNESAPFDHPQLFISNGHVGNENLAQGGEFGQADMAVSAWLELPAIGAGGRSAARLGGLKDFAWTLQNGGPDFASAKPFRSNNKPPKLPIENNRSSRVGEAVDYQFVATDVDNDALRYSASGLPSGTGLSAQGRLSGRPTRAGDYLVTVLVTDGQLGTSTTTFTWTIN
jgi:cytochrome c peroxidase